VKTPVGPTKQFKLEEVIFQGSVFGPIKCVAQVDSLGRDQLSNSEESDMLYKYRNVINIPALSYIDDILGLSKCGSPSLELNAAINAKVESKKLYFNQDKCYSIHIAHPKNNSKCMSNLMVHENKMQKGESFTYLGDVLSKKGGISETIKARKLKAIGINGQISTIVNNVSLGYFHFKISFILRESMLLNGTLTNCEVWNSVTLKQIQDLEAGDLIFMKKCYNAHAKTAIELYYLESGKIQLRHIIAMRRIMYWWHILSRPRNELIRKVYELQKRDNIQSDWIRSLNKDKETYDIHM
jgi:hypothetical protein